MHHQGCFQRFPLVELFQYSQVCRLNLYGVTIGLFSAFHQHVFVRMQGTHRQPPYHPSSCY